MRISGFYQVSGKDEDDAREVMTKMMDEEVLPGVTSEYWGEVSYEITDVVEYSEEEYEEGKKEYDVHFIMGIEGLEIEEFTEDFYRLEELLRTGIGILEE